MDKTEYTTVMIDKETRDRLKVLAKYNERSMAGHLRWLVNYDWRQWNDGSDNAENYREESDD